MIVVAATTALGCGDRQQHGSRQGAPPVEGPQSKAYFSTNHVKLLRSILEDGTLRVAIDGHELYKVEAAVPWELSSADIKAVRATVEKRAVQAFKSMRARGDISASPQWYQFGSTKFYAVRESKSSYEKYIGYAVFGNKCGLVGLWLPEESQVKQHREWRIALQEVLASFAERDQKTSRPGGN